MIFVGMKLQLTIFAIRANHYHHQKGHWFSTDVSFNLLLGCQNLIHSFTNVWLPIKMDFQNIHRIPGDNPIKQF